MDEAEKAYIPQPPPRHPRSRAATITSRLLPFSTSSPLTQPQALPPLSRIDPSLAQKPPPSGGPLRWDRTSWTAFLYFLTSKGYDIVGSVVSYGIYGPPRPSWGLEMTLIAAFMRNVGQHSALVDIGLVRQLISFHHLVPLPADGIVTPISFRVKKRPEATRLRGFFEKWDEKETGERELAGEWVVGKKVYERLRKEKRNRRRTPEPRTDSLPAASATDSEDQEARCKTRIRSEKVIYYIHGGAYYVGSVATHRLITIAVSKVCDARVFALNYRLAPETRFPEPLLDVVNGYFRLIDDLRIAPSNIIVMGDSAGGGMALAMTMYLRDEGYSDRMPRALVLMSPWVDLTMSCGSWDENAQFDVVPRPGKDDHLNPVACYLGPEGLRKYLTHPYASPLFGDLAGLPPMLIQAGDAEVLRDEITLLAHKAALAGVQVKHELHIDQVHVFQTFPFLDSAQVAFDSIGMFVTGLREGVLQSAGDRLRGLHGSSGPGRAGGLASVSRSLTPSGLDTVGTEIDGAETKVVRRDGTGVDAETSEEELHGSERASSCKLGSDRLAPHAIAPTQAVAPSSRRQTVSDTRARLDGSMSMPTSPRQTRARQPLLKRALSGFAYGLGLEGATPPEATAGGRSSLGQDYPTSSNSAIANRDAAWMHDPPEFFPGSPRRRRPTVAIRPGELLPKPKVRTRSKSHSSISTLIDSYGAASELASPTVTVFTASRRGSYRQPEHDGDDLESEDDSGLGLALLAVTSTGNRTCH